MRVAQLPDKADREVVDRPAGNVRGSGRGPTQSLDPGNVDGPKVPQTTDRYVDLGGEAATGAAQCLLFGSLAALFCARSMLVGANNGVVEQQPLQVMILEGFVHTAQAISFPRLTF